MASAQISRLENSFANIENMLSLLKRTGISNEIKEVIRAKCRVLLNLIGDTEQIHPGPRTFKNTPRQMYLEPHNGMNYSLRNNVTTDINNPIGKNNENYTGNIDTIRNRFRTRKNYETYEPSLNDPLVPVLSNKNKNRIWPKQQSSLLSQTTEESDSYDSYEYNGQPSKRPRQHRRQQYSSTRKRKNVRL
jgi:hypothetical protein